MVQISKSDQPLWQILGLHNSRLLNRTQWYSNITSDTEMVEIWILKLPCYISLSFTAHQKQICWMIFVKRNYSL